MKKHTRFLALLLTAIMRLSLAACGGNSDTPPSGGDTPNTDTSTPSETSSPGDEPAAPPHAEGTTEDHIIRSLVVNLLEFDNRGKLQSSAAKEWGTEDGGQTWTFKLRDDVTWVDVNGSYKADVAADDWGTTPERLLNCHKNNAYNTILSPTSQKLIDELGVENVVGMSNEQMWYSGAYTLTTYISSNEKVLTRNPAYFDKDCTRFDTVTIRVVESALVDDQPLKPGLHLQGLCVL